MHYDYFYYGPDRSVWFTHEEAVYNKLFEQFIQNVSNLLTQENERGNVDEVPSEAEPVKAAPLVGSIIVFELKRKFRKNAELE